MIEAYFASPYDTAPPKLKARFGYTYGMCPRLLYYASKNHKIGYTTQANKNINYGSEMHETIENEWIKNHPDYNKEHDFIRNIDSVLGIEQVSCHADLSNSHNVIEIKPRYSIYAYYQTLIQKFVLPKKLFWIYSYVDKKLFPIQADYNKAIEKVGNIITALNIKPPRFPNANYYHKKCVECLYRETCYTEPEITWDRFNELAESQIVRLRKHSLDVSQDVIPSITKLGASNITMESI